MAKTEVTVKAWRDPAFRSQTDPTGIPIPGHPCGSVEFDDGLSSGRRMMITASTTLTTCEGCCNRGCDPLE